jgi:hypothetical protein
VIGQLIGLSNHPNSDEIKVFESFLASIVPENLVFVIVKILSVLDA